MAPISRREKDLNTFYISFRAIRVIVISLSAILAIAVLEFLSYFGPEHPLAIGFSWVLIFGMGVIAAEIAIHWAKTHGNRVIRIADGLAKSGERYRRLINGISEVVALVDLDGNITYYNDKILDITGYPDSELRNKDFFELFHPGDSLEVRRIFEMCLKGERPFETCEVRGLHHDGHILHFELRMQAYDDEHAEPAGCEVVLNDVTEHRAMLNRFAETETRWQQLVERSSDGIVLIKDSRLTFVNPAIARMVGRETSELIGKPFMEFIHPDALEITTDHYRRRFAGEDVPSIYESKLIGKDGRPVPVEINAAVVGIPEERVDFVIIRDLTLRKERERRILELEQFSQRIIEQSPVGIMVVDKAGTAAAVNDALIEMWGLPSREDVVGKFNIFYPGEYEFLRSFDFDAVFKGGTLDLGIKTIEVPKANEKGKRGISVSIIVFPVFGESGEFINAMLMCQDVTENVEAQKELSSKEERLKLFFENANDAIFISSPKGKIIQVNPAAEGLTGYSADELAGMTIHDLFDVEDRELSLRQLAWMKRGNRVHFESVFIGADGTPIDVDISGSVVRSGDENLLINIVRDITERKRFLSRLSQNQKMESLGVMAGGIAHDFNNILEGIIGAGELAQENARDNEELSAYIDVILSSANRGARLIKHLLGYARQSELESEIVDLNQIAEEAYAFLTHTLDKRIHLRLDLDPELGPITGDPSRLQQIIVNLALNSQDAMPDGGEILIKTRNISVDERFARDHPGISPGPHIELVVEDSGLGIDRENLPKVFDPFFTTKSRGEGTGLGLTMVYNTVASHGGIIDLRSRPGEGTVAYIYFPAHGIELETFENAVPLERIHGYDHTVMVIDDEDVIQTVLGEILVQLGYKVIHAKTGKEALEILTESGESVDIILLDMIMPGLSGGETFKRLTEYWPEIPVVVVTGYADEKQTQEMLENGLAGFIEKPFKAAQIAEKLNEILKQ